MQKSDNSNPDTWYETLKDLVPRALDSGIEKIEKLQAGKNFINWPPNVLEFKAICLSWYEDLGLPPFIYAYDLVAGHITGSLPLNYHPVVHYVASKLDENFFILDRTNPQKARALFKSIYDPVCHLLKQGCELPKIDKPLIRPEINEALSKARLNQIKANLNISIKKTNQNSARQRQK